MGALGNVLGTTISRHRTWSGTSRSSQVLTIVLANILGMMLGFTLGVLIRNSAGAVVTYLVYGFVHPASHRACSASSQEWFRDLQPVVGLQLLGVTPVRW